MSSSSNILITGGTGLVGSACTGNIRFSRSGIGGDLRNPDHVDKLFDAFKPKYVIHCAARVGGIGGNSTYKGEYFYDNIMINTNVIHSAHVHGVEKLVAYMSTCVFPDDVEYPLTPDMMHLGEPHSSNYAYAYAKRMAEVQIRAYREQYGREYVSVIPTNVFGPHDNFDIDNGHVLPSLIHKCFIAKETGRDFTVWGTGRPLREFIYSKDLGKLTDWVLHHYSDREPLILSTSEEVSIKDIVGLIVDKMKFTGKVVWDKSKPDGQYRKSSDNSKIKELLPDFKFTPLDKAIEETVEWFKENYPANTRIGKSCPYSVH